MVKARKEIQRYVDRIVQKIHPEKVILFGSYAYGRPNRHSDVDLFVIKASRKRFNETRLEIDRLLSDRELPIDIVVRSPSHVRKKLRLGDCFTREVMKRGLLLYEK